MKTLKEIIKSVGYDRLKAPKNTRKMNYRILKQEKITLTIEFFVVFCLKI